MSYFVLKSTGNSRRAHGPFGIQRQDNEGSHGRNSGTRIWEVGSAGGSPQRLALRGHRGPRRPSATCEMCEPQEIRYVHHMEHPSYPQTLGCGCVCAGHMEDDYKGAREREKTMRNARARRQRWLTRDWRTSRNGNPFLNADGGFRREVQPRRQHWFLNEKSGFPFRTPAFCSVSRGRRRLGEKEYRAPSVTPGVALRPRTQGRVQYRRLSGRSGLGLSRHQSRVQ